MVTWASIFPLDVIKTRLQTQPSSCSISADQRPLILAGHPDRSEVPGPRLGAYKIARLAYQEEGTRVFFRGLGVCSLRAFIVNAVQVSSREGKRVGPVLMLVVGGIRMDHTCSSKSIMLLDVTLCVEEECRTIWRCSL